LSVQCGTIAFMSEGSGSDVGGHHHGWTVEEMPRLMPGQSKLYTHLAEGRRVTLDAINVERSTSGWYAGQLDKIWDAVIEKSPERMDHAWGKRSTYMIPPVSLRPDLRVLSRWRVHAWLKSEPVAPVDPAGADGSALVIIFFCNDIASQPITALLGDHLASMDENTWHEYATNFRL